MAIKPEILAPAGKWDVLEAVIAAGADAVYLGGKRCNMRLHTRDFNFDDDQLARAVEFVHAHGKKIYITLNNLQTTREIDEIRDELDFLRSVKPDALIVQDLGLLRLLRGMKGMPEIHVSTMVNAHNAETLRFLARHGITRVVLSKDLRLADVRRLHRETGMDLEYFVHGDTCVAQHGSCSQSGIVFGASSNKGRCYKSCRWDYVLVSRDPVQQGLVDGAAWEPLATLANGPYVLAHNDLCLLSHIPELVQAEVRAFKIEGRMRPADYVSRIVEVYRKAIDRYFDDPSAYLFDIDDLRDVLEGKVRDLTTGATLHAPRVSDIGTTGEREPKIFSVPVKEKRLSFEEIESGRFDGNFPLSATTRNALPFLSVRVGGMASARSAISSGADAILIGGDVAVGRATPWRIGEIRECIVLGKAKGVKVYVASPSHLTWRETAEFSWLVSNLRDPRPDGYLVGDLGAVDMLRRLGADALLGDFTLNVMNHESVEFLAAEGFSRVALSRELAFRQAHEIVERTEVATEILVHGPVESMRLDHCLIAGLTLDRTADDVCPAPCRTRSYALRDGAGDLHTIEADQYCRNRLLLASEICVLPYVPAFARAGFASLRIDAQYDAADRVAAVVAAYRKAIDDPAYVLDRETWERLTSSAHRPLGLGPHLRGLSAEARRLLVSTAEA